MQAKSVKSFFAVLDAEPFEQSKAIFIPEIESEIVDFEIEAIVLDGSEPYPCPTHDGIGSVTCSENGAEDYPLPLKILIPLNSKGLCDAEIIIPASALYFLTRYATALFKLCKKGT